ncbi:Hypothetical protein RADP37_04827 [Roseomonas mucosa]|uniref:Phage tail protein n=1 Tax=Roseomonas mucosa TaxID=207340 RepID=A0A4Y1MW17_9PROT|nr:phage tail tube protein [Roseomonas mucosa]AWV21713.1 Hypothetical protein RADP37_04827 [Roseomonas mucosa]MDT8276701.1 phage tail tube protein [Roseomonas mucosa]MDT8355251.1 phage tail tube protein [Roseomonas mucosa]
MGTGTGAGFRLYSKEEPTPGTAATGNYDQLPCFTFTPVGQTDVAQDQILSANTSRDAGTPYQDGPQQVTGEGRVPMDTVHIGKWLKLLLGAPTTTGTAPNYTHVFKSGGSALPARSFEKAFPAVPSFYMLTGARANTLALTSQPRGGADATFGLIGLAEADPTTVSGAGVPVVTPFTRFMRNTGVVKRVGTTLAGVTSATLNFSNNMAAAEALRSDRRVEDIDFGQCTASGAVTLRFYDDAIQAAAKAFTASALELSWAIDVNTSIAFLLGQTYFQAKGPAVTGPGAITRDYSYQAGNDGTAGVSLLAVTLKNQVASYA